MFLEVCWTCRGSNSYPLSWLKLGGFSIISRGSTRDHVDRRKSRCRLSHYTVRRCFADSANRLEDSSTRPLTLVVSRARKTISWIITYLQWQEDSLKVLTSIYKSEENIISVPHILSNSKLGLRQAVADKEVTTKNTIVKSPEYLKGGYIYLGMHLHA